MREDELIREVDRRHVIQLFDLFADSPYNDVGVKSPQFCCLAHY